MALRERMVWGPEGRGPGRPQQLQPWLCEWRELWPWQHAGTPWACQTVVSGQHASREQMKEVGRRKERTSEEKMETDGKSVKGALTTRCTLMHMLHKAIQCKAWGRSAPYSKGLEGWDTSWPTLLASSMLGVSLLALVALRVMRGSNRECCCMLTRCALLAVWQGCVAINSSAGKEGVRAWKANPTFRSKLGGIIFTPEGTVKQ
eukprot:1161182-Pelagomonas_calceolata.AAC.7